MGLVFVFCFARVGGENKALLPAQVVQVLLEGAGLLNSSRPSSPAAAQSFLAGCLGFPACGLGLMKHQRRKDVRVLWEQTREYDTCVGARGKLNEAPY